MLRLVVAHESGFSKRMSHVQRRLRIRLVCARVGRGDSLLGMCSLLVVLSISSAPGCVPRERHEQTSTRPPAAIAASAPSRSALAAGPEHGSDGAAGGDGASVTSAATADPELDAPFSDDFNRGELGPAWRSTSPVWRLSDGRLCGENARNHPVWLARRLPTNARVEFQASSDSRDGDIKAEYWGDGRSAAAGQSYTDATSYLTIFGGWKNTLHVLARIDEHAPDRREVKLVPGGADFTSSAVVPNRFYQFQVERRDGRTVRWLVDGMEVLTYPDTDPLQGPGHEHFGFNDWQVRVCFDDLRVTPVQD